MKNLSLLVVFLCFGFSCGGAQNLNRPDVEANSQNAFSKMQTLEGAWKRKGTDGSAFQIVFSFSANKSLLIEDWQRKGKSHSLTVYHLDNQGLLATHYCPQGNQPRLRMYKNDNANVLFTFQDGTHLEKTSSHQSELSFEFSGGEIVRRERYSGDPEESVLELERMK